MLYPQPNAAAVARKVLTVAAVATNDTITRIATSAIPFVLFVIVIVLKLATSRYNFTFLTTVRNYVIEVVPKLNVFLYIEYLPLV